MRRNQNLIVLSRQHHHMLILAQVLKSDVPPYQNMPKDNAGKLDFLHQKLIELIVPNFLAHRKVLYPALIEWSFSNAALMDELRDQEDNITESIHMLKEADEMELHEIGLQIEELVRKKERQLYQQIQEELEGKLVELDFTETIGE